jgi:hypothetical protein
MNSRNTIGPFVTHWRTLCVFETLYFLLSQPLAPDGHFKLPHLWPVKLPHGGRSNYDDSAAMAMRAAASLSR